MDPGLLQLEHGTVRPAPLRRSTEQADRPDQVGRDRDRERLERVYGGGRRGRPPGGTGGARGNLNMPPGEEMPWPHMSEFRLCIHMQRSASPFVTSCLQDLVNRLDG